MKNTSHISKARLVIELVITIVVAYLIGTVLNIFLALLLLRPEGNGSTQEWISFISAIVMGILIGYKLNTLIRLYRAEK